MTALLTNELSIRGETFTVSEIDARTMKIVRKTLTSDDLDKKSELESIVAQCCLVSPKLSLADVLSLPSFIVSRIAEEAYRLTNGDAAKNA